ncbi:MAG: glycoside hydrolase family 38 C-terminal domain-containing protein [Actinomycetaceae bacterium]|nr:glycoside hydrolase family 38 C-terminal domain-containing protein [Actinomycetaceae bacterium]
MDVTLILKRVHRTLTERVMRCVYTKKTPLQVQIWRVPDEDDGTVGEPTKGPGDFSPFQVGKPWGKPWQTVWFRFQGRTPAQLGEDEQFEAVINLGWADHSPGFQAEGLVRDEGGHVLKAINPRNQWVPLPQTPNTDFSFTVEAAANPLLLDVLPFQKTADGDKLTAGGEQIYTLTQADLAVMNKTVAALVIDLQMLHELLAAKEEKNFTATDYETLGALNGALDALDLGDIAGTAGAARAVLAPILSRPALPHAHRLSAVGHAHIDSAWLWPIRETKRKVCRTLANVVRLLEDGADMYFALPAAQHVAWLKETEPELFTRVKDWVRRGRICPVGGMWVEPDAMLPGGEALARQLVEGLRFFEDELGVKCAEIWLPDSFGYSAALPQFAREAGITRFLTQKISWNQTNVFPHHTLTWEGIDGSRIFTHFPPADTYGSEVTGAQLLHAANNFKNKGQANSSLLPYGYGDGGGGPTREMLARLDRVKNYEGAPQVISEPPTKFFDKAEVEFPHPPVWTGELYLELHRGTLTSQIRAKQGNRRVEALLKETEYWCTVAALNGAPYPHEQLRKVWHDVLLCQFHDILPGTSVAWVYREVDQIYANATKVCEDLIARAFAHLGRGKAPQSCLANATCFPNGAPPFSAEVAPPSSPETQETLKCERYTISNGKLSLRFDESGALTELIDKNGQNYIPCGEKAGIFQVFQDFPNMWDAWDIDAFYQGTRQDLPMTFAGTARHGDTACGLAEIQFGNSRATIEWQLPAGADYVDVHVGVDWHEHERLLKLAFPVDIHTDHAQYETQMGYVTRPTHTNTSWEAAKFEVSAHRWLRLANTGKSLSIANDATYGWDITRHSCGRRGTYSLVRATLVKSAVYPDPHQDQGCFTWNFRIRPGATTMEATADGHRVNLPPRQVQTAIQPPFGVSGAVVESVCMVPDSSGDVAIRLYEGEGAPSTIRLTWPGATVRATDLLYRDYADPADAPKVYSHGDLHEIAVSAFQIVTLRVRPGGAK